MFNRGILVVVAALAAAAATAQDLALQGVTSGNFRFKDIGGQAFAQPFADSYSYSNASVAVSFDSTGQRYLAGNITATGLKPNFAYQVKLVGNPSKTATTAEELAAADDATNERIGRLGRWWRVAPSPGNSTDSEYDLSKDSPGYIYEGYLVLAFFVTDAAGNANLRFEGNNSFHVLWRVDQRPRSSSDGPAIDYTVPATDGNTAYDVPVGARNYSLYGEYEPTRALPGTLQMTDGHYRCRFVLHEESFHDSGALAGSWALAMTAPIEFDMPFGSGDSNPPPPDSALPLEIASLRASLNFVKSGRDRANVTGALQMAPGATVANLETQISIMGVTRALVLNSRGRANSREGGLSLKLARDDSGRTAFKAKISGAKFSWTDGTPVLVTLKLGADDYAGSVTPESRISSNSGRVSYKKPK